jgi:glycosidase
VIGLPTGTDGYPWWNDTVFYEIFVRSFYDSDGDGIGDLNGLTAKLDYLNDGDPSTTADLGVAGLWLMPIQPAVSYHGYDVTDYYAINPDYGTLDDFKRLLEEAHKRGIRVLIDWVPNHTSSQHPWFQSAQDPQSPYHDWYVWSPESKGSGWHRGASGEYYYGYFWEGMPDLNYTNPAVSEQMYDVARFWLEEAGVATLLLTAPGVPFLYYGEEIGLLGKKPDEDIRLPMQWTADTNGGFTTGRPWRALNADYAAKNVAIQTGGPDSLLSHYRALIALRNNHAALRVGETFVPETGNLRVAAILRVTKNEAVLAVVNLGKDPVSDYSLALAESPLRGGYQSAPLLGAGPFAPLTTDASGAFAGYQPLLILPPYSTFILQLQLMP